MYGVTVKVTFREDIMVFTYLPLLWKNSYKEILIIFSLSGLNDDCK